MRSRAAPDAAGTFLPVVFQQLGESGLKDLELFRGEPVSELAVDYGVVRFAGLCELLVSGGGERGVERAPVVGVDVSPHESALFEASNQACQPPGGEHRRVG